MDINDFIDQLADSPKNLYELHTKVYESSSDDDASSLSLDEHYKPPLYTFDQLNQNLVVFENVAAPESIVDSTLVESSSDFNSRDQPEDTENTNDESIPENIAKLSRLIVEVYCAQEEHNQQSGDIGSIREKLETQLLKLQINGTNETETVFNTPLSTASQNSNTAADADNFLPESAEHIANYLSQRITQKTCFICNKKSGSGSSHYLHSLHYNGVRKWLEMQISKLQHPVEIQLIFCEICNLPLSGDRMAKTHYDSKSHEEKAKIFCTVCLRVIGKNNMASHCNSKDHLAKVASTNVDTLNSDVVELKSDYNNILNTGLVMTEEKKFMGVHDRLEHENVPQTYASALKGLLLDETELPLEKSNITDVKDSECAKKDIVVKGYARLANYILKFLSETFCYVCNMPSTNHYKSQIHNINMHKWLEGNRQMLALFNIDTPEEVVCIVCRSIFFDSKLAESHYMSEEHKRNIITFCKKCMIHDDPSNHITHNEEVNERQSKSIKENLDPLNPAAVLALNLKLMCTPVFCEACQIKINLYNPFHYSERNHILMVRTWLGHGMQKIQTVIDPKLVFCEPCGVILCGTKLAHAHYQLSVHILNQQTYCAACAVRGTPNAMAQHSYTWEHKFNVDNLINLQNRNDIAKPSNQGGDTINNKQLLGQNLSYKQNDPSQTPMVHLNPQDFSTNLASFMKTQLFKRDIYPNEEDMYSQMNEEVKTLLETLYLSERVPVKQAVMHLKRFNVELVREGKLYEFNNNNYRDATVNKNTSEEHVRENSDTDIMQSGSDTSETRQRNVTPIGSERMSKWQNQHEAKDNCSID